MVCWARWPRHWELYLAVTFNSHPSHLEEEGFRVVFEDANRQDKYACEQDVHLFLQATLVMVSEVMLVLTGLRCSSWFCTLFSRFFRSFLLRQI